MTEIPNQLIILEMANNHMGDVSHGVELINTYGALLKEYKSNFKFAFKFQFRDLDTFIHPDFVLRNDLPYIKRFNETRLTSNEFKQLFKAVKNNNFYTMVTCFDNNSVNNLDDFEVDFLKVASCSFTDWPLLESLVTKNLPIIASCAGSSEHEIESVVTFMQNRIDHFALLHCVAEYPTQSKNIQLGQIEFLKTKFNDLKIGYSTHEDPTDYKNISLAIASGATIFEKHVALPSDNYSKNKYSTSPEEFMNWLKTADDCFLRMGTIGKRYEPTHNEIESLISLRRGVFANRNLAKNEKIGINDVFFAFPAEKNQLTANNFSKYSLLTASQNIPKNKALDFNNTNEENIRKFCTEIEQKVNLLLFEASINLPKKMILEISHHYGVDSFYDFGMCIFTLINRAYCKKLLILFPNQKHPEQFHKIKEETFMLVHGDVYLSIDGIDKKLELGEVVTIKPNQVHKFSSDNGAIIEEISDTHTATDSYYVDDSINQNLHRKTLITFYQKKP